MRGPILATAQRAQDSAAMPNWPALARATDLAIAEDSHNLRAGPGVPKLICGGYSLPHSAAHAHQQSADRSLVPWSLYLSVMVLAAAEAAFPARAG
jgi:hypothetical protein